MQPAGPAVVQTGMPRPSPQSAEAHESQLLRRVADRERPAFEELYTLYHRRLSRFLMRLAPRYDFAEEIINDTFWVVWRKAGEFRGASRVSSWIRVMSATVRPPWWPAASSSPMRVAR